MKMLYQTMREGVRLLAKHSGLIAVAALALALGSERASCAPAW